MTDDLREWDYGDYEGRKTADIRKEVPGWTIWAGPVPGGETSSRWRSGRGESSTAPWPPAATSPSSPTATSSECSPRAGSASRPTADGCSRSGTASLSVLGYERETRVISVWNQDWQLALVRGDPAARAGGEDHMKATQQLREAGQSLWLDNITRGLLTSGTLKRYIDELSITGLTSNPTIFDHAISKSHDYDARHPRQDASRGESGEALFFELAVEDLTRAADLFRPIHDADGRRRRLGVARGLAHARLRHRRAPSPRPSSSTRGRHGRTSSSRFPGTREGIPAIEEAIFAGVPINVTLLFSRGHYLAAAEAYMRGIERRIAAGLNPDVRSVASVFISRWDKAVAGQDAAELHNQLGIAMAKRTYKAYRDLLNSDRWQRLANAGARPQRLLWASTGTKDPEASDVLYVKALAAPEHGQHHAGGDPAGLRQPRRAGPCPARQRRRRRGDAGPVRQVRASTSRRWPPTLQKEGAASFVASWNELMAGIAAKSDTLKKAS